ncbi:reverse transcriptase-like protein [Fictibacillus phosphorivorans]|uniref:reverse transcriptase-like protein n=1 Tax=Fictibacillus phosphorivorans TaxID=1221500 RepID=UPI00203F62A9|nr:reverse transcriptase-like protein [Fictibacillus phosphorivorans]MCM3719627.1 reverse transcriptase-like protein [Fictibacillus phosphorivorans]MCM3777299.1 reverse transcriptase-like protein [Fictibacillus phosphorivorans]
MKFSIEYFYKHPKSHFKIKFVSDPVSLQEAIFTANDLEKTGRLSELLFVDSKGVTWTKKELLKLTEVKKEEPKDIRLFFDGGFLAESGISGQGIVIYYSQNGLNYRIKKNANYTNLESNNEAEYAALWEAARELEELGVQYEQVVIQGDSKVVIEQMKGEWPCYEVNLQNWADKIDILFKKLQIEPVYEWIARNENKDADHLVNQALNGKIIKAKKEVIDNS